MTILDSLLHIYVMPLSLNYNCLVVISSTCCASLYYHVSSRDFHIYNPIPLKIHSHYNPFILLQYSHIYLCIYTMPLSWNYNILVRIAPLSCICITLSYIQICRSNYNSLSYILSDQHLLILSVSYLYDMNPNPLFLSGNVTCRR
jgi:hypothetical protein